jgi:tRNA threonylcarbamoyladenosine biosynthesis protein TsaE
MPDSRPQTHLQLTSHGLSQLDSLADRIVDFAGELKVWLLEGEMGAGKTTLAQALCRRLGVSGSVQSPTYALVNEYEGKGGQIIYHFDFYRIKDETEAMDMGVEEYFDSGNHCLVEWPSRIPSLIPNGHLTISILLTNPHQRILQLSRHGQ